MHNAYDHVTLCIVCVAVTAAPSVCMHSAKQQLFVTYGAINTSEHCQGCKFCLVCMLCRSLCDRQAGSLAVRPTKTHFMRISRNWWWQGTVAGLRDRAMFLEQLYTAGRGGDMRELELADRFPYSYPTRPREATAILSIQQNGKTNQVRHKEAALTSKLCCQAARPAEQACVDMCCWLAQHVTLAWPQAAAWCLRCLLKVIF